MVSRIKFAFSKNIFYDTKYSILNVFIIIRPQVSKAFILYTFSLQLQQKMSDLNLDHRSVRRERWPLVWPPP